MKPTVVIVCLVGAALLGVIGTQQWSIGSLEESLKKKSEDYVLLAQSNEQLQASLASTEKRLVKAKRDLEVERGISAKRERDLTDNVSQLSSNQEKLRQELERERENGSKAAECMDLDMPDGVIRLLDPTSSNGG
ncbi:hypothetical protein [Vibrio cholerae]|uniref:hypothetical protein n=1 Tax=Vibrio cholerae TaxID=666 RepID=UPI000E0A3FD7|nr:hypothetical protein [Vibrio cholerae]HDY8182545.1 hypothetical protein [Vibrio vulnificus]HDZ9162565.1 hypothetical protein [Vibrio cholerae]